MQQPKKVIGILGGAGPAATANFFLDIVGISQKKYNAEQDTDFPTVYLYNMPMDGFDETGFADPERVREQLLAGVKKIESWGADFITMPCNTIHHFIGDLRTAIQIPIVSIIESTVAEVKKNGYKKVGILSSTSTRHFGLYEHALKEQGVEIVAATNTEQKALDDIILAVMAGKQGAEEKAHMKDMAVRMHAEGAEAVVLGCTELPLAFTQTDTYIPVLNTIAILAERAVGEAYT